MKAKEEISGLKLKNDLKDEDGQVLKQFDKLDNRTNTFLSITLAIFSYKLQ
ncbi:hypothetical protein [Methanosphaera sp. BMS]|uniref:hypothetical protein n=1 Tax=Methanosphaera sp. BMS TaxID=1789762 RepID=UPI0013A6F3A9|nr:hypothetical protein [Methanosphaera sp. BMS]